MKDVKDRRFPAGGRGGERIAEFFRLRKIDGGFDEQACKDFRKLRLPCLSEQEAEMRALAVNGAIHVSAMMQGDKRVGTLGWIIENLYGERVLHLLFVASSEGEDIDHAAFSEAVEGLAQRERCTWTRAETNRPPVAETLYRHGFEAGEVSLYRRTRGEFYAGGNETPALDASRFFEACGKEGGSR